MNITDVRIRKITSDEKMKAIVSITLDDAIVIHDIKIIEGKNGKFIAMPSRKFFDGDFRDVVHPINADVRKELEKAVFEKYEIALLANESMEHTEE